MSTRTALIEAGIIEPTDTVAEAAEKISSFASQVEQLRDRAEKAERQLATARGWVDRLTARVTQLETAAAAGLRSLSSFIFDSSDPGADAFGAQWLLQQAMPQADDPFAQPGRYRDEILREAAKRQREFVLSDDFVCDDWEAALDVVDLIDPDEQPAVPVPDLAATAPPVRATLDRHRRGGAR